MKTKLVAGLVGALVGLSAGQTFGAVQWYQISFTGADLWTSSPDDNVSPTPAATMANPRLWVDWNASQGGANYAPLDSGSYTSFNTWKTTTPFAFSTVNLWGNGNLPLSAGGNVDVTSWGETYIASQWYGVTGPAGSSAGTSPVTSVGAIGTGSFASWANLTMGYPGYGSSVFTADVALADTSPVVGGQLRIWFDGYNSDSSAMIEGAMNVNATPISDPTVVPETGTVVSGGFALLVVVSGMLRSRFQKQA